MQKRDSKGRFERERKACPCCGTRVYPLVNERVCVGCRDEMIYGKWQRIAPLIVPEPITPAQACAAYLRADALREAAKAVGCFGLGFVIGMWG